MNNRSVPTSALLPHLVYRDLEIACKWLTEVFGFTEHFRYGEPLSGIQMLLGNACIMLTTPRPGIDSPARLDFGTQILTVIVQDADAHHLRATQHHASIWEDLHETVYGEKQYGVEDYEGHRWLFSEHVHDVDPRDWGATIKLN